MRKLYLMMLMLISAIAVNAGSITLNIADPNAVTVKLGYTAVDIVAGENVITYDESAYQTLYINANTDYRLDAVTGADTSYGDLYVSSGYSASVYLSSYTDGRYYTVSTTYLPDIRTATLTVKVSDDYSLIRVYRGSSTVSLTGAETEIKFDPNTESSFRFSKTSGDLYSVTLNGEAVTGSYYTYYVTASDGDVVEIQANFPDVDVPVFVNVPEGCESVISSFSVNSSNVTNYLEDDFTVKAGDKITMYCNTTDYSIESILINDVKQSSTYYVSYTVGTEAVYIDINAHKYADLSFTLNIDDPTHVLVYPGNSTYGTAYTLVAGENQLTVNESKGQILIKAADDYLIKSITDGEGNELTLSSNCLKITDGMVINVTTAAIEYDSQFVVFLPNLENMYSVYFSCEYDRAYVYINSSNTSEDGYFVKGFSSEIAASNQYMFGASGKYNCPAYFNDELFSSSTYVSKYFYAKDGDIIKIYCQENEPKSCNISFVAEEGIEPVVTYDIIKTLENWSAGLTVLEGTRITIKPNLDVFTVKVDDEALVDDDNDGIVSFNATGDNVVTISATSAVESISVDHVSNGNVYNMQGILILKNADDAAVKALPAGLYIVNGKKVLVR